jgi:hypothetical protein
MLSAASVVAVAIAASAVPAEAALSAAFSWSAPAGCIAAAELSSRVSARLGRLAFVAGPAEVHIEGAVEGQPSRGYQARFRLLTAEGGLVGVRAIGSEAGDCRSLDEALVVVLSVMLNVRREDVEAAPVPWRPRVGASSAVVAGLVPAVGLETALSGGLQRGPHALDLELALQLAPSWAAAEGQLRATAGIARLAVSRSLLAGERVALGLRLAGGAGARWLSATGFDVNRRRVSLVVEARLGPRLDLRLWRGLWMQLHADLGVSPVRPRFDLLFPDGQTQTLFRPGLLFGAGGVGLAGRFR